jgi:hypothetical protein
MTIFMLTNSAVAKCASLARHRGKVEFSCPDFGMESAAAGTRPSGRLTQRAAWKSAPKPRMSYCPASVAVETLRAGA